MMVDSISVDSSNDKYLELVRPMLNLGCDTWAWYTFEVRMGLRGHGRMEIIMYAV